MPEHTRTIVLAFSGGLDTSYCVASLVDTGSRVVTVYVDTGGAGDAAAIERRAFELGADQHIRVDASEELWTTFVTPFIMAGEPHLGVYPLLCSDRYAIASATARIAHELGADAVAHGCTAMGNDQVRLDIALGCLTRLPIVAAIRDLQGVTDSPREHEIDYLRSRGHDVDDAARAYSINENILGVTISGSEIDTFEAPNETRTRRLSRPRVEWPAEPISVDIDFEAGVAVAIDGVSHPGPLMLRELNERFGAFGVGRGVYTGDTILGLKGRIVFEAPGLTALLTAHRALEQTVLTREQGAFKPLAARKWAELAYSGLFFDPLREDIEAMIRNGQRLVTGAVTLRTHGGSCEAVAVRAISPLMCPGALYAQRAPWSARDAAGFVRLFGLSTLSRASIAQATVEPPCPSAF